MTAEVVQFVPKPHPQRQLGPVSPLAAQVKQELASHNEVILSRMRGVPANSAGAAQTYGDFQDPNVRPYLAPDQDPA